MNQAAGNPTGLQRGHQRSHQCRYENHEKPVRAVFDFHQRKKFRDAVADGKDNSDEQIHEIAQTLSSKNLMCRRSVSTMLSSLFAVWRCAYLRKPAIDGAISGASLRGPVCNGYAGVSSRKLVADFAGKCKDKPADDRFSRGETPTSAG